MPFVHLGAVAQQQRRVVERAAHVEPRDLKALRPRIREERSDRGVQPLRLAQHDVHQLLLLAAQRQFLTQDLDRAGHRRQRVADLVRDAGRHLADRREPLLNRRVALELLDVGDVLEREEQPGAAARRLEVGRGEADVDLAALSAVRYQNSWRRRATFDARSLWIEAITGAESCSTSSMRRPTAAWNGTPVIASAPRLKVRIAQRWIGGRQPARQAVDDVLVQRLQVRDLGRRLFEPGAGGPQAVGQRSARAARRRRTRTRSGRRCTAPPTPAAAPARRPPATDRRAGPTPPGTAPRTRPP